ncbi:MAG: ATP-binding protein [Cytophagaceae bacterium]|jgi:hypothetical protein|nr:ATP-binding protein [Cytophagaceae bacterium]
MQLLPHFDRALTLTSFILNNNGQIVHVLSDGWKLFQSDRSTPTLIHSLSDDLLKNWIIQQLVEPKEYSDLRHPLFPERLLTLQSISPDATSFLFTLRTDKQIQALQQLENLYQFPIERSHVGLFYWLDQTQDISWWSDSILKKLGYTIGDIQPSMAAFIGLLHPDELPSFLYDMEQAAKPGGNPTEETDGFREMRLRCKDGTYKTFLFTARVENNPEGGMARLAGTAVEIDEFAQAREELKMSRNRLDMTMKATSTGTWDWNILTNTVEWSTTVYDLFNIPHTSTDITFEYYLTLLRKEDRISLLQLLDAVLRGDQDQFTFEHPIYFTDENFKFFLCKGQVTRNPDGSAQRMSGVVIDITGHYLTQLKLKERDALYKSVVDSMSEGILIYRNDGIILETNKEAQQLLGIVDTQDIIGKPIDVEYWKVVDAQGVRMNKEAMPSYRTLHTGLPVRDLILGIQRKNVVSITWLSVNTEPVLDVFGKQLGCVTSFRDITSLTQQIKHIQQKNTQLEDFAHITSHNLRSPVTNLHLLLDYYKSVTEEEEKEATIEKLRKVTGHLLDTIHVLADSLKTQSQTEPPYPELNIVELLEKVELNLAAQLQQSGISIDYQINSKYIKCPPTYLESILMNLISNAIKYKSDKRQPKVEVYTYNRADGYTVLEVKDNGVGIPLERYKHKLFGLYKTFHQHPESRGVGLYMTKRQVDSIGGQIEVESIPDKGSTFRVIFIP